jgi:Glycosyl hydrolases family 35
VAGHLPKVPCQWVQCHQVTNLYRRFCALSNTLSIYFFWSYHSPSKGVYDFETSGKNLQRLLDYAKDAGLWVIARAGPYCNAETNGGGLALWGSDGSLGSLRTSDSTYYQAWLPWITKVGEILASNEITKGGVCSWPSIRSSLLICIADHSQPNRERASGNNAFCDEYSRSVHGTT